MPKKPRAPEKAKETVEKARIKANPRVSKTRIKIMAEDEAMERATAAAQVRHLTQMRHRPGLAP